MESPGRRFFAAGVIEYLFHCSGSIGAFPDLSCVGKVILLLRLERLQQNSTLF